ncbi:MAG: nitrophenyl compound nitroreductase subunit ArsF family protein [Bacteroidia bacterium]|nr:nitrophenyl compound nitroreductase subunit ArsF family protein [Bacteroidia bacterium]
MKRAILLSISILFLGCFFGKAQTSQKETSPSGSEKIEAYYFHFNARCETCRAVESEAKADILSLYPGRATFRAINLDEISSKAIAEKLKVSGQTLLIVKGDKQINLTNEGFLYATTNPTKLKSVIKQKVDGLLDL